jgi:hypothetical protein
MTIPLTDNGAFDRPAVMRRERPSSRAMIGMDRSFRPVPMRHGLLMLLQLLDVEKFCRPMPTKKSHPSPISTGRRRRWILGTGDAL